MLAVIFSFAEMANEELDPQHPARDCVTRIGQAAQRAAALTRQLLTFSRQGDVQPVPTDLNALIHDTRELLQRPVGGHRSLLLDLAGALPLVVVDPGQLEQVLVNLVLNACDAMPSGGAVRITTGSEQLADRSLVNTGPLDAGLYVLLTVEDSGAGIPPEVLKHIFEPFFTTKPRGQGTGLGLATAYGVVRQAGGGIRVETAVGHGTSITLLLPVNDQASADERPSRETI